MRPLLLEMENFRSFHKKTVIDFEHHIQSNELFLITGDTGSGKSTILDAMMYALYATTPTGHSRDILKSQYFQQGEAAEVRFVFQLNHRYEVYRSLKTTSKDYLKEDGELIATKSKEVTKTVTELLGLTDKQFQNVIVLPQGKLDQFLVAKEKEKKDILRTIFQLGQLQEIAEKIKKKSQQLSDEERTYYSQIETHLHHLVSDDDIHSFLESWYTNKERIIKEVQQYKEQYAQTLAKKQQQQQQLGKEIKEQQSKLNEQERINEAIQKEKQQQNAYQQLCHDEKQLVDKKSKVAIMDKLMYHGVFNIYDQWKKQEEDIQLKQKKYDDYMIQYEQVTSLYEKKEKEWLMNKAEYSQRQVDLTQQLSILHRQLQVAKQVKELEQEEKNQQEKNQHIDQEHEALDVIVTQQRQCVAKKAVLQEKEHRIIEELSQNDQRLEQYMTWLHLHQKEEQAQQRLLDKEEVYQQAKQQYQNDYDNYMQCEREFIQASASRLAATLDEGEPCPVCGSCNHPHLAPALEAISEQLLMQRKEDLSNKEQDLSLLNDSLKQASDEVRLFKLKKAQCALEDDDKKAVQNAYEILSKKQVEYRKQHEHIVKQLEEINKLEQILSIQEERLQQLTEAKQEGLQRLNQLQGKLDSLREEYDGSSVEELNKMKQEGLKEEQVIKEKLGTIEKEEIAISEQVTTLKTTLKTNEETLDEMKYKQATLHQKLEHQFIDNQLDEQTFLSLLDERQYYKEWQKSIREIDEKKMQLETSLNELSSFIAGRQAKDTTEDEQQLRQKQEEEKQCIQNIGEESKQFEVNIQTIDCLFNACHHYDDVNRRYEPLQRLEKLWSTNGRGSGIETFIMGHYFKQMIQQANYYLLQFSRGRYRLKQDDANILNLLINDGNTGQDRVVSTLSGGERFMCTLSLSLGMADVIGHRHSGVMINALFIDEGFGTLDEELLDQAMNLLYKVQKEQVGGMIGIISHIPTLRDNINHQLQVKTGDQGSRIQFVKK